MPETLKKQIHIPVGDVRLEGELVIPAQATGLVIFSHGSGSSRLSPRNNMVAEVLRQRRIGTLLFDLLTVQEDAVYANRFDIDLLTHRLMAATGWAVEQNETSMLKVGYLLLVD